MYSDFYLIAGGKKADDLYAAEVWSSRWPNFFVILHCYRKTLQVKRRTKELNSDLHKPRNEKKTLLQHKRDIKGFANCLSEISCNPYLEEGCPEFGWHTTVKGVPHLRLLVDTLAANFFCSTHLPFVSTIQYEMETVYCKPAIQCQMFDFLQMKVKEMC